MISLTTWSTMMTGQLECPPAHAVIKVYPMFEWRRDAGKLTNIYIQIREITHQAIPVKAAQSFHLDELLLRQVFLLYRAVGSVMSTPMIFSLLAAQDVSVLGKVSISIGS